MEKGLVLEKMQVLPTPGLPIMNRLIGGVTNRAVQPAAGAGEIEVNLPLVGFKANRGHLPGRLKTQGRREQQIGFHGPHNLSDIHEESSDYADFHTERKSAEKSISDQALL
jgi:hypothetical protein